MRIDCSESRLMKIIEIMKKSEYGIHDLSLNKSSKKEYCRMNMPLELGIDFGLKSSGNDQLSTKSMLILEKKKNEYDKYISDLSGNDIFAHENKTDKLVEIVRDWLVEAKATKERKGSKEIWNDYNDFNSYIWSVREKQGYSTPKDKNYMPTNEMLEQLENWLSKT